MNADTAKVVLIDDDSDFRKLFINRLNAEFGNYFDFIEARTMAEGIEKLHSDHADAVLLDLTLPDSEADKTVRNFKRLCPRATLILVISGDTRPETKRRSIDDNAWGCIEKDAALALPRRAGTEIKQAITWHARARAASGEDDLIK